MIRESLKLVAIRGARAYVHRSSMPLAGRGCCGAQRRGLSTIWRTVQGKLQDRAAVKEGKPPTREVASVIIAGTFISHRVVQVPRSDGGAPWLAEEQFQKEMVKLSQQEKFTLRDFKQSVDVSRSRRLNPFPRRPANPAPACWGVRGCGRNRTRGPGSPGCPKSRVCAAW
jgi:hypothetical protein